MNPLLNELASHITGKSNLQATSLQELETLVNKYPAFSTAHLLLAAKSSMENSPAKDAVWNKAQLFFSTGLWHQSALLDTNNAEVIFTGKPASVETTYQNADIIDAELEKPATKEELVIQTNEVKGIADEADDEYPELDEEDLLPPTSDRLDIKIPADLPSIAEINAAPGTGGPGSSKMPDTLTFEPFHTVDYFASQGIRFKDEQISKDKFSVQLRSFTDWLKTMKRIPEKDIVPQTSASDEKKVAQMAEVSISPREVVTETMAEVWEKQGNLDKAIQVYKKLSLLDPGKSAYFAAKIEQLKKS